VQYGVIVFWGLSQQQCETVLTEATGLCQMCPLADSEVEQDSFSVNYGPGQHSMIENDRIIIPQTYSKDWRIKMAISHALAQSTKLCLYEARMGCAFEIWLETFRAR
jgi:uncharacterized Rmd1/YagE family protein